MSTTTEQQPAQATAAAAAAAKAAEQAAAAKATADAAAAGKTAEQLATEKAAADAAAATKATADAETKRKADEAAAASKAPEKYALTLPEGSHLDASDVKAIEEAARAANLTNDDAQAWLEEQHQALVAQSARYRAEVVADPDLGGDKLAETEKLARVAVDRLFPKGDPHREAFITFINRGGAGNNINVVRAFVRIGKLMAEDTSTGGQGGSGGSGTPKTADQVLYGGGAS